MIELDDALKKEYKRLKELLGEEEGEKFIEKNRGCGRNIFMKLLYLELIDFYKKKPLLFIIYLIVVVFLISLGIYMHFTY